MSTVIVVPCYNEAARWKSEYWSQLLADPAISLIFVDDGSRDGTAALMEATARHGPAEILCLNHNSGKAEAVRQGMLKAFSSTNCPAVVGFLDADAAFPVEEVLRLAHMSSDLVISQHRFDSVWSARILMAGRQIERHASRHYIGRIVSTVVSPLHRYDIYDTQSGFKLFGYSDVLERCLTSPFETRWFPDIELLQRWSMIAGAQMRIWEEPVMGWKDVAGSKVNRSQYVQLVRDLGRLYKSRVQPEER